VTPTIAEANGLTDSRGVLVVEAQGGPDGDGLRGSSGTTRVDGRPVPVGGDVVVGIGGTPIWTHEELMRYLITETRPGEPVDVDVVRAGTERRLTLDERPVAAVDERRRGPRGRGGSRIPIE
jgi:S1-C subfamily serine protease